MESVKSYNTKPPYLLGENALSEETAKILIELVEERGKKSTWDYNPDCYEFQIANPFSPYSRQNDDKIISILPDLFALGESCMRKMNHTFTNNVCDIITGHHGFWVLKYGKDSGFEMHCDWYSGPNGIRPPIVATACIVLNDDYEGGETVIECPSEENIVITRNKLSIIMWDGFTQHKVSPITEGTRYALVLHYTGSIK